MCHTGSEMAANPGNWVHNKENTIENLLPNLGWP